MEISTNISPLKNFSNEYKEIITTLKDGGFTAYDFSMYNGQIITLEDYIERAKELREHADKIGIVCNQTHAPFATRKDGDEEYNKRMDMLIKRSIEVSGILGAKICVIHPVNGWCAEKNAEMYKGYEELAKERSVKIALENMWNWNNEEGHASPAACSHHDDFLKHLSLLNNEVFVACLDIGHAEMKGLETDAVTMIKTLGKHLQALHIHDNNKLNDNHRLPYSYNIDYGKVITALKEIGYDGDITFESDNFLLSLPKELVPSGVKFMADMGKYFKSELNK